MYNFYNQKKTINSSCIFNHSTVVPVLNEQTLCRASHPLRKPEIALGNICTAQ